MACRQIIFFFTLVYFSPLSLFTQVYTNAPTIEWQMCAGGSNFDQPYSIAVTSDGGFVIAGLAYSTDGDITNPIGGVDYWMVKTDSAGNILWEKSYGGNGSDEAFAVEQTMDGGYVIAGTSTSFDGQVTGHHGTGVQGDYWIVKTDSDGNLQWQKALGGDDWDEAYSVRQTSSGEYVAAGYASWNSGDITGNNGYYDFWIVKLSTAGNLLWQKPFGGSGEEIAKSIQLTTDGGYIAAGYTQSTDGDVTGNHGNADFWVVKTDSDGNLQWQKTYGGTGNEKAEQIQKTSDGGYVLTGVTTSKNNGDITGDPSIQGLDWVVKIDNAGNIQWQKLYGGNTGPWGGPTGATSIYQTVDGGYVFTGNEQYISPSTSDGKIFKIDSTGNLIWQKSINIINDIGMVSVQQLQDSGYVVLAYSNSTDNSGTLCNHGNFDYNVFKLCPMVPAFTLSASSVCPGDTIFLTNTSENGTSFQWYIDGTLFSTNEDTAVVFNKPGYYLIKLLVSSSSTCTDSIEKYITVNPMPYIDCLYCLTTFCEGDTELLSVGDPASYVSYLWSTGNTTDTIMVDTSGTYYAMVTDTNGCSGYSDTVNITVYPAPVPVISASGPTVFCPGDSVVLTSSTTGTNIFWFPTGDTVQSIVVTNSGIYYVFVNYPNGCYQTSAEDTVTLYPQSYTWLPSDFPICPDSTYQLDAGPGFISYLWSTGDTTQTIIADTGIYFVQVMDTNNCLVYDTVQLLVDTTCIPTDVLTLISDAGFNLHPNPASQGGMIYISSQHRTPGLKLKFFTTLGTEAKVLNADSNGMKLDELPRGIYIYKILNDKNGVLKTGKFVVH